jgi:Nitroreductase family
MSSDSLVLPPHDLEVSLSHASGARFSLSWSSGGSRVVFETESREVAAALLRRRVAMTVNEFTACLIEEVSLDADQVASIVTQLARGGFFGDGSEPSRTAHWAALGWADALLVHGATANAGPVPLRGGRPTSYRPNSAIRIPLPDPMPLTAGYEESRARRRTHRDFHGTAVSLVDIATIAERTLPATNFVVGYFLFDGLVHESAPAHRFSAYAYDAETRALTFVNASDAVAGWSSLLWGQSYGDGAPVAFVLGLDWQQYMWTYRMPQAYRWIFSALGSSMQTAITVASALGLKTFQTASVNDTALCELLRLDPRAIYPAYWANFGRMSGT